MPRHRAVIAAHRLPQRAAQVDQTRREHLRGHVLKRTTASVEGAEGAAGSGWQVSITEREHIPRSSVLVCCSQSRVEASTKGGSHTPSFLVGFQRLAQRTASALHSSAEAVALSTHLSDESWFACVGRSSIFHTTIAITAPTNGPTNSAACDHVDATTFTAQQLIF